MVKSPLDNIAVPEAESTRHAGIRPPSEACLLKKSGRHHCTATVNGVVYDFQIKHFDEPSEYGIDSGRISKLWMRRRGDAQAVLGYDRRWERGFTPRGKSAEVRAAYRAIIAKFN